MNKLMNKLETNDGCIIEEESQIVEEVIGFCEKLYTKEVEEKPVLMGLDWSPTGSVKACWLERPCEEDEIKMAVFDRGRNKSPGPDGFSMALSQGYWEVIKDDLLKVF